MTCSRRPKPQLHEGWRIDRPHRAAITFSLFHLRFFPRPAGESWRLFSFGAGGRYQFSRVYCCVGVGVGVSAGVGVPLNQPAAYAITSNTTITPITPYQRRLSLKSIGRPPVSAGDAESVRAPAQGYVTHKSILSA